MLAQKTPWLALTGQMLEQAPQGRAEVPSRACSPVAAKWSILHRTLSASGPTPRPGAPPRHWPPVAPTESLSIMPV